MNSSESPDESEAVLWGSGGSIGLGKFAMALFDEKAKADKVDGRSRIQLFTNSHQLRDYPVNIRDNHYISMRASIQHACVQSKVSRS